MPTHPTLFQLNRLVILFVSAQFEQIIPDLDFALNYPVPIPPEGNDEMYGMVGKLI